MHDECLARFSSPSLSQLGRWLAVKGGDGCLLFTKESSGGDMGREKGRRKKDGDCLTWCDCWEVETGGSLRYI